MTRPRSVMLLLAVLTLCSSSQAAENVDYSAFQSDAEVDQWL